jgi:hypothetical protein
MESPIEKQIQKCGDCEHKRINPDKGWCYMFSEMILFCEQYKSFDETKSNKAIQPTRKTCA